MKAVACTVILCLLPATPTRAQGACTFDAWAPAPGGAEVPIHAAASATSKVVGHVPVSLYEDRWMGGEFRVLAISGDFAQVTGVQSWDGTATAPDGWIGADAVKFVAQTNTGFASPDVASAVVAEGDWFMPWDFAQVTGCSGEWAQIAVLDQRARTVWVRRICANQETTCDMGPAD